MLILNKKYAVMSSSSRDILYIGAYSGRVDYEGENYSEYFLKDVTRQHMSRFFSKYNLRNKAIKQQYRMGFELDTKFYDLEEIRENGKKARQSMEQRSLNIILKRLVNENFEW
jgi:hypothetical protein